MCLEGMSGWRRAGCCAAAASPPARAASRRFRFSSRSQPSTTCSSCRREGTQGGASQRLPAFSGWEWRRELSSATPSTCCAPVVAALPPPQEREGGVGVERGRMHCCKVGAELSCHSTRSMQEAGACTRHSTPAVNIFSRHILVGSPCAASASCQRQSPSVANAHVHCTTHAPSCLLAPPPRPSRV